ncbi:LIM domain-containing protein [Actinidia chinensis var. chinensis]|uniref:LIM domain-containing protein n=1 Tax=Actinidia chinensis var. chinensis TaxID=1590841 RepID=A0A2R6P5P9_ACTCC|nr:LIM domain-containing protein [Actinidia chinensis var. chinensis]
MQQKRSYFAHRACNILRLALLWARKGGAFKRRLITDLRSLSKFLKNLGQSTKQSTKHYGDHELSFENTPIIHIKIHRPSSINFWMPCVPCISPKGDLGLDDDKHNFEFDNDFISSYCIEGPRKSFSSGGQQDYQDGSKSDGDVMGNYCNDGPRKNFLLDGHQSCEDDSKSDDDITSICCNDRPRKTLLLAGHEDFEDDSQSESDVTSIYYDDSPRSFWLGGHEDFEDDFESHGDARSGYWNDRPRKNILLGGNDDDGCEVCEEISSPCDKEIDQRADQFIAKFYDELKLQRQTSCVQYDDTFN